jgi:3-hydroxyacyl-[acyl-carrier-protein] dehydratase
MDNNNALNKVQITNLLPHREPMLLIDELVNIMPHKSAVGIINVKKDSFFFKDTFLVNQLCQA